MVQVAYPQFQDSALNLVCFSSTVPGLHAGEGAERNGVYPGCMCQNEGKAQTQTRFCAIICTLGWFLFWGLQHSFPAQVWIRNKGDLLLYPLSGGSVSPPISVFFLAAVICLLLSRLLVFYSNADSHSLSWSLCSYLTLSSSAAAVWRDILIFMIILVLLYLCWHIRGLLVLFLNTFMHLLL